MEISMLAAKLYGATFVFMGLGMLFNGSYYHHAIKEMIEDEEFKVLGGMLALIGGILMTSYHNIWQGEWWVVLLTIFGWASLIKGALYLMFPKHLEMFLSWYKKEYMPVWSILVILLGGILGYYGFAF